MSLLTLVSFETSQSAIPSAILETDPNQSMDAHETALKEGFLKADLIITTGGSSMGTSDVLKPVIEQRLHGEILFGRVKVKPGKPTIFAEIPCDNPPFKPLFGLPGNPASALVTSVAGKHSDSELIH